MAEERAGDGGRRRPRKSPDVEARTTLFAIKGRRPWKAWVEELAAFDRLSVADLIDRSLANYARAIGFEKNPPVR